MKIMLLAYRLLPAIATVALADQYPEISPLVTDDLVTVTVPQSPTSQMSVLTVPLESFPTFRPDPIITESFPTITPGATWATKSSKTFPSLTNFCDLDSPPCNYQYAVFPCTHLRFFWYTYIDYGLRFVFTDLDHKL
ncbi:hypothetical protein N0V90_005104 [Kalmusia sp. IMI 367209]|nr:hypothetical protein N0V90_005104 [Kalmusia sp. IMI 367209]